MNRRTRRLRQAMSGMFLQSVNFNAKTASVLLPNLQDNHGKVYISEPFNATKLPNLIEIEGSDLVKRRSSLPTIVDSDGDMSSVRSSFVYSDFLDSLTFSGSYENVKRSRSLPQLDICECMVIFYICVGFRLFCVI